MSDDKPKAETTHDALRRWVIAKSEAARNQDSHWRAAEDDGSSIARFMLSRSELPMWDALLALLEASSSRAQVSREQIAVSVANEWFRYASGGIITMTVDEAIAGLRKALSRFDAYAPIQPATGKPPRCECGHRKTSHKFGVDCQVCDCPTFVPAAGPTEAQATRVQVHRTHRFDCADCGEGIAVDEDWCCRSCGADATVVINGIAHPPASAPIPAAQKAQAR